MVSLQSHVPAVGPFFLKEFLSSWLQKGQRVEWRLPEHHFRVQMARHFAHCATDFRTAILEDGADVLALDEGEIE